IYYRVTHLSQISASSAKASQQSRMADMYRKVGRGGAGNFYSQKDAEDVAKADLDDVEVNASSSRTDDLARAVSASKPPPEYLHTGRGGAGNWVQPSELNAKGLEQIAFPGATSPTGTLGPVDSSNPGVGMSKRVLGASKPSYRGGRGGAGNYVDFAEEERARKDQEERVKRVKRETEERITRDVEAGLSKPPRAYGGRGGAWEMGSLE
ncbi:hypothetical protein D0Z07_6249, partial [Hyphodiscus hymeniophilus]